ncbi:MAG: hypothetical protein NVSMB17_00860 [Candidatus Dormibacteria bacterium]
MDPGSTNRQFQYVSAADFPASRVRVTARWLATIGAALVVAMVMVPAVAQADQGSVPIDAQGYVYEAPVDPYNNDKAALHVSANGGSERAQSYFHLNFNYLPEGASLDSLKMQFTPTAPPAAGLPDPNNAQSTTAILEFCILAEPIPANLSSTQATLKNDCAAASKTGAWQSNGTYQVDLKSLAAKWLAGKNYGAVILPLPNPGDTYAVSFDRTKTTTTAVFTPPAATSGAIVAQPAPQPAQPAAVPAPATTSYSGGGTTFVPGVTTAPDLTLPTPAARANVPAPAPVIHHQATPPAAPAAPAPSGPGWALFALAIATAGGVGLMAYPVGRALSATGGVRGALLQEFRVHPRLVAVTGVLAVYSLSFGSYTLAHSNVAQPASGKATASGAEGLTGATPSAEASLAPGATPAATTGGGATGGATTGSGAQAVAPKSGSQRTIHGTSVFVPDGGGPPVANLFSAADDHTGLSADEIRLCGHAALTYAGAFQTTEADFNVFWSNLNDSGGINGRRVNMTYQNDDYKPDTAVKAAEACKNTNGGIFFLLGGIGFDQIPAVRLWAEQNRMLYLHHIATAQDADRLKYSFAPLPTVEDTGRMFGDLYVRKFSGKKLGILHRGSAFWDPGYNAFRARLREAGQENNIVYQAAVQQNQGSYANELVTAKRQGAEVMWSWENALDTPEMIKQAKAQQWSPSWLVFPFNVELTALGTADDALNPPLYGVAAWPAYTKGQYEGPFASYAADIQEFEREYAKYRPNTKLDGAGGDLLFLNWVAQKQTAQLLLDCGRDCSRNKLAGMLLTGYKKTVSPNCPADWSRTSRRGGYALDIFQTFKLPDGKAAWQPIARCVEHY